MDIAIAQEASGSGQKYECSWCHKTFNRPSSLAVRLYANIHTGEKPFVCNAPGCGRSFSVLSNMRRHARTHDSSSSRGKRRSKASHMRKEGDPEADGEGGEDEDPNSGGRAVADIQDADSADSTRTSRMTDTRSDRRSRFPSSSQASSTTMATTSELELEWAADEARASHTARERHHFRDRDRRPSPIFTSSEDELDTETEGKQLSRA
ncbi:uncharacterized protein EI90DRAFT_2919222 [Cantharellus anzutake]|uniref:uncharacterized protein n=1 Tax=Cantharellus anzutake TaxID=1750568 RepID=UPI001906FA9B|nr:uncharacterized protein EI90DRAFT_2919222 [Cantharellus anzutake]KAF8332055.1 hypothetical protein EI90DRAFT_2919222 [Cantharellus anzutake]